MRRTSALVLAFLLSGFGCGNGSEPPSTQKVEAEVAPNESSILPQPFTAEEIREEWIPGLFLLVRLTSPEGTGFERWTVVSADKEGADIEYIDTDGSFSPTGEPKVVRSTWVELRDHATFPAEHSTREWVSRSTDLGDFEGWIYRVADPGTGRIQEFFFAPTVPGAPIHMRILEGGQTVFELEQVMRMRPTSD